MIFIYSRNQVSAATKGSGPVLPELQKDEMSVDFIGPIVGIGGFIKDQWGLRTKSKRLEKYLLREKTKGVDKGQRSLIRIMRDVGLTEAEIIQASARNPRIGRVILADDNTGIAKELLFEYRGEIEAGK